MGQTLFPLCRVRYTSSMSPQQACYLPSIASTHSYTWFEKSNFGKVPYSRTQQVYRNGAWTDNLLLMNPALIHKPTRSHWPVIGDGDWCLCWFGLPYGQYMPAKAGHVLKDCCFDVSAGLQYFLPKNTCVFYFGRIVKEMLKLSLDCCKTTI